VVGGKLGRLGRLFALFFALVLVGTACGGDDTTGAPDRHLSVAEAREETRENPDDPDAWKALASALSERGQTNAAIPAAQRLLSLRPKSTDAYRRLAVLYMAQGRAYQQDSQPAKARASFKRAVATYRNLVTVVPKNKYARIELGQAAEQAGDPATAIAAYTAYLRLTPNDPNAKYVRQWLKRLSRS
jgi:tetratricopeptide (TPR) repeat protein